MDNEILKLKELWRTRQITDAEFVERSNQLAQGAQERNSATLRTIRGSFLVLSYTKESPTSGHDMTIVRSDSTKLTGEVLEVRGKHAFVLVYEGTAGIDNRANFELTKDTKKITISTDLLGRAFNGSFSKAIDRLPLLSSGSSLSIQGG